MSILEIIFYILLIDSIGANLISWGGGGKKWYKKKFQFAARLFPATKGWTSFYLILVLLIGYILFYN